MKTLDFVQLKQLVSVIDVAKQLGYSDRTQWARSKRSRRNPCLESPSGDKIIISNPFDYSRQVYRNPYDSNDFGDVITFVGKKLNLDARGITEYLTNFTKNVPVNKTNKEQQNYQPGNLEFQHHYFKLSELSKSNYNYLLSRNISDKTLNSPVFKGVFKDVQIPVLSQGKFLKHSEEHFIGVTYHTALDAPVSAIDYRNAEVKKFGISSQKSISIGFSNIPQVIRNIKIAESPIDAASHYQLNPEINNDTLYVFTGGNLSLGQLLAIDKIIESLPNEVHTTLLFDKDVAGTIYDLNFLCHRLENPFNSLDNEAGLFSNEEILLPEISVQQSLESVTISINTDTLTPDQLKRIFNCEAALSLKCTPSDNILLISVEKKQEEVAKLVELLKQVFPVLNPISIEKTPVGKDWNNQLKMNSDSTKNLETIIWEIVNQPGNILTFKEDFPLIGIKGTQIGIETVEVDPQSNAFRIKGFGRDTPWFKSVQQLSDALDLSFMSQQFKKLDSYFQLAQNKEGSLFKSKVVDEMSNNKSNINLDTNPLYDREYTSAFMEAFEEHLFQENKVKQTKEAPLVGYQFTDAESTYEIYSIRPDGKMYYHDLSDNTKEFTIHIDNFFSQLRNNEIASAVSNPPEKRNYAINYMNEFYPQIINVDSTKTLNNNQAAKPVISSQNKMNQMAQSNAGEHTQKSAAEKLEGTMKSLGLKDVWDIIKPAFEAWANDPKQDGRKSFKAENLTFRRTGFSDDAKGISTDMLANVDLNFNKKNGTVYFNSYTPELMNSIIIKIKEPQSIKHTFDVFLKREEQHNNLTIKKALNLLDGRSVHLVDNNWLKYDQAAKKIAEFKFDLERAIKENKKMDFSSTKPEHMDSALQSLLKGDFAMIGCTIDNKPVTIFLTADAQYKKVEANDSNLYRHLNQEERKAREENMSQKQGQAQGNGMHP